MSNELTLKERIAILEEAEEEIMTALENAWDAVKGTSEEDRAKGYWWAHIRTSLDRNHSYLGSSMTTMQDTIDSLKEEIGEIIGAADKWREGFMKEISEGDDK